MIRRSHDDPPMPAVKRYRTKVVWRDRPTFPLEVEAYKAVAVDRCVTVHTTDGAIHLIPLDQVMRIEQVLIP